MNENFDLESHINRLENLNDVLECIQIALSEGQGGIEETAGNALFEINTIISQELEALSEADRNNRKFKIA